MPETAAVQVNVTCKSGFGHFLRFLEQAILISGSAKGFVQQQY